MLERRKDVDERWAFYKTWDSSETTVICPTWDSAIIDVEMGLNSTPVASEDSARVWRIVWDGMPKLQVILPV